MSARDRPPDLGTIAAQLSTAMAFVEVAVKSLEAKEVRCCGAELLVLEHGLAELKRAHTELDRAAGI